MPMRLKVGIRLASLRQPLKKALHTAARLGAHAVEIDARGELRPGALSDTGVRQIRKVLGDLDLRVCAIAFHTRRGYDNEDDLERRIDATRQALQMAHKLGAQVVVNQVGRVPDEPGGRQWDLLLESLTDLGRYGQRAGALLAAQTGAEEGKQLRMLIEALPAGALGVDFNPGNLVMNGFSATEALDELAPYVLHVHAKDAARDLSRGRGIETAVGRGVVDFPALMGALEERRYDGYFTVERDGGDDPEYEIGEAVKYLRSM